MSLCVYDHLSLYPFYTHPFIPPFSHLATHSCMHASTLILIYIHLCINPCMHPSTPESTHIFISNSFICPSLCTYVHPLTRLSILFCILPFQDISIHPQVHSFIHLYILLFTYPFTVSSAKMFWASLCTRSRVGYCCCGNELILIWSHRNRYLNRHLKYKINNRGLDSVFWEHHGVGGREEVASACHLLIRLMHRSLV